MTRRALERQTEKRSHRERRRLIGDKPAATPGWEEVTNGSETRHCGSRSSASLLPSAYSAAADDAPSMKGITRIFIKKMSKDLDQ
jgi:hypothetical protein